MPSVNLIQQLEPSEILDFPMGKGSLSVFRLDVLNDIASGNKAFKLKFHLLKANQLLARTLLSFGGPWSNHLHALAWVAHKQGFKSVGFIRGEMQLNPMLEDCRKWGMELVFLGYSEYRKRHDAQWCNDLQQHYPSSYLIPEGGGGLEGAKGCGAIVDLLNQQTSDWDTLLVACGTGTTLAGIASVLPEGKRVIGLPVLAVDDWMKRDVDCLLAQLPSINTNPDWCLLSGYDLGGFAKTPDSLIGFIKAFEQRYKIALDPIYTAKLFFAVGDLYQQQLLSANERVVLLHSGGLQGRRGFNL